MTVRLSSLLAALLLVGFTLPVAAQPVEDAGTDAEERRAIPYPIDVPAAFEAAVEAGTRTRTGEPGPNYWTNTATYDLDATLDPSTAMLDGTAAIEYVNNSPDTLHHLEVHLRQNVYTSGTVRNRTVTVTGGMQLGSVRVNGQMLKGVSGEMSEYAERMGGRIHNAYSVRDTRLMVYPKSAVAPGDTASLQIEYRFKVPGEDNFRMGQDGETFYLGYWYPQMAVYDDVHGWKAQPYQGDGEFYMGFADYDISFTAPEDWLVASTGILQNPDAVLTGAVQERLEEARTSDEIVSIVGPEERGAGSATVDAAGDSLTWAFRAERVRDVAIGTSDRYVWDAAAAETGDGTAMVHSLYRPEKELWERSAEYARFSVEHLSEMIGPYPFPHMTVVDGIPVGGMEYPMMTIIGGDYEAESLFSVTYHEISHMWIPMLVSTDEKTHAWMDEGMTEFNESEGEDDFFPANFDPDYEGWAVEAQQSYYRIAGTEHDAPSMRHADNYTYGTPSRVFASYSKPRVMLHALRGVIGEETFFEAYRTFFDRWAYKHPTPYDFFNTVEDVAGRELDWFWTGAFGEAWTMDHAIASVDRSGGETRVTVADRGKIVLPVKLQATLESGETVTRTLDVDAWLDGAREVTLTLDGTATSVTLDPEGYFPDVDRSNNTWTAAEAGTPGG